MYPIGTKFMVKCGDSFGYYLDEAKTGDVLEVTEANPHGHYVCRNLTQTGVKKRLIAYVDEIGESVVLFNAIADCHNIDIFVIKDTQRLEELTEWCRNKPEEAAVRIMAAEKLGGVK